MIYILSLLTFGIIFKQHHHPLIRRRCSPQSSRQTPFGTVMIIGLISLCLFPGLERRFSDQSRRIECFNISTSEHDYLANPFGFVGVFLAANLHGFVGDIPEQLLHDVSLSPINPGESQSFLKPSWPGDYDNTIIMQLMSSDSVMASRVQWRDRMHKKIVIPEMNLCVIGLFPSLDYCQSKVQRWFINASNKDIYLVRVGDLIHSLEIIFRSV